MSQNIQSSLLTQSKTWDDFCLDDRIKKAIVKLKWTVPSLVQSEAIPYALQGKDVLAKARTGSGKTGAFAIPIIQRVLSEKEARSGSGVRALVLVPTTELAEQVRFVFADLCYYCTQLVRCLRITSDESLETQAPRLAEIPDVVVATPGRLVAHLIRENIDLSKLQMLVIDEADLVMGYGYKEDLEKIKGYLPSVCQGFLMSATLSKEVTHLKNMILHTPVILELEEEDDASKLKQFVIHCLENDKFLLLYVLLKLKLITGKSLIFVNDINRCFQLKLFLERFSIACAVMNADLPQNSRYHIVQEFNRGIFDLLIATDVKEKPKKDKISEVITKSKDILPEKNKEQTKNKAEKKLAEIENSADSDSDEVEKKDISEEVVSVDNDNEDEVEELTDADSDADSIDKEDEKVLGDADSIEKEIEVELEDIDVDDSNSENTDEIDSGKHEEKESNKNEEEATADVDKPKEKKKKKKKKKN